jgi:16S rRNA (uracil1498-N3)-methyltransferase
MARTLLVPPPLCAGDLILGDDEAHHGRTVLRLAAGDPVRLADGAGRQAEARVVKVGKHDLHLAVEAPQEIADGPGAFLTIAVAPPKGDRLGDLVRQVTELGVGGISFLATERGERMPANPERLVRIAGEALKQCRRAHLPVIHPPTSIPALVDSGADLIVLDRSGDPAAPGQPRPLTLVIGPEGGFTPAELTALRESGASLVRLAHPVLRIETAALAAAAVWSAAWQRPGKDPA